MDLRGKNMIKDITGIPLLILIIATILDLGLVTVAIKDFLKNK